MRIAAISDLHGYLPAEIPAADLVIIAGDVCPDVRGTAWPGLRHMAATNQAAWLAGTFAPWLERLETNHIVLCWGNHDYVGEFAPEWLPPLRADVITDDEVTIGGLRLYGMPWTFTIPGVWAFDVPPERIAMYAQAIPEGIDILVTHGPPYGRLDRVVSGERAGSRALAEAVARVRPRLHVFGHIHEARGQTGNSYNVALVDAQYQPYDLPVTMIDL